VLQEEKRREELLLTVQHIRLSLGSPVEDERQRKRRRKAGATAGVKAKLRRKASPVLCSERVAIVSVRPVPRPRPQLVPGTQYFIIIIIIII
jgi:hypothetical protein